MLGRFAIAAPTQSAMLTGLWQFHDGVLALTRLVFFVAASLTVYAWSTGSAHAYLDPGLGSMLLQGLVAGVAAVSVVWSGYWSKVKRFFARRRADARQSRESAPN